MEPKKIVSLPNFMTGPVDVSRLTREAETIDDSLHQLKLRKSGTTVKMPKTSQLMDKLIRYYNLNMLHEKDRQELNKYLTHVKTNSPRIHMSFSSDASPIFLEEIVEWLRKNIHPEILLSVGLQPTIGVGCIVRTNNKYFDFSINQNIKKSRGILLKKISDLVSEPALSQVAHE